MEKGVATMGKGKLVRAKWGRGNDARTPQAHSFLTEPFRSPRVLLFNKSHLFTINDFLCAIYIYGHDNSVY